MLDGVMGRVIEVYQSICSLANTDFPLFEDVLCDLKLKPQVLSDWLEVFVCSRPMHAWMHAGH